MIVSYIICPYSSSATASLPICFPTVIEIGFTPNSYIIEEGETAVLFIENRYPDMETEVTVRVEFISGTATGLIVTESTLLYYCCDWTF